ncbi:type II CAAX endopeptidase family protein [Abyssisolibacter fermentans]|uniref:type II CAAX endopeptidase family protein n=1 Tax=Abyssisolibacter fermentans TaxID=1766203 RepID=UPI000832BB6D|nr:type II CAAX endopeptidase family protein [Abyssisolibacter fermentans]
MENKIERKKPDIFEANLYYTIIGFMFLTLGAYVQKRNLNSGLLITELIIICLPVFIYLKIRGYDIRSTLRLNKLSFKQVLLIPLITILFYPLAVFFNSILLFLLSFFGKVNPMKLPAPQNVKELLIGFIIVAVSAGICEEIMFRGFIMSAYKRVGVKKSIIISAVLFGFFHFNIQNLVGPIFLGIIFGYMVYKTNSIFASIIAHITNNAFVVFLSYLIEKFSDQSQNQNLPVAVSDKTILAFFILLIGVVVLLTVPLAIKLMKKLSNNELDQMSLEKDLHYDLKMNFKEKIVLVPMFIIYFYRMSVVISYML